MRTGDMLIICFRVSTEYEERCSKKCINRSKTVLVDRNRLKFNSRHSLFEGRTVTLHQL